MAPLAINRATRFAETAAHADREPRHQGEEAGEVVVRRQIKMNPVRLQPRTRFSAKSASGWQGQCSGG